MTLSVHRPTSRDSVVTVAYVDDVTFVLRSAQEVNIFQHMLMTYTQASGAVINFHKSSALALGGAQTHP